MWLSFSQPCSLLWNCVRISEGTSKQCKGYLYLPITSNWSAGIPPKPRESLSGAGNWAKPRKARPHDHTQHHPLSTVSKFQLPDPRTYHARGGCILPSTSARGQHNRHDHAHTSRTRCPPPITRRPPGPTPCPRTTLRPRALRWSGCARTCAAAPPVAVHFPLPATSTSMPTHFARGALIPHLPTEHVPNPLSPTAP